MKTICIIPARSGSKGLKNKNLRKLNNKPLIYWPIKIAKSIKEIDLVVLSTDSKIMASYGRKFGAEVPFLRPKSISGDHATTEEVLQYTLKKTEENKNKKFDICVFLTCTDIFRDPSWIRKGIRILKNNNEIESCFAANSTTKNYWHKTSKGWKRILSSMKRYSNRQTKKQIFREDTGLTCVTRSSLIRKGKRIGDKVELIINHNTETVIDIHTEYDLFLAEQTIKYYKKKNINKLKLLK